MDTLLGADCGLDIYEEPDENKWVECELRKSKLSLTIGIPVIIVIVLLFVFFGSSRAGILATLAGSVLIGGLILGHLYWTPSAARTSHRRFQREVQSYIDNGMSRADAIKEIKKERLKREEIAEQRRAAKSNAAGMFAIANALRSK